MHEKKPKRRRYSHSSAAISDEFDSDNNLIYKIRISDAKQNNNSNSNSRQKKNFLSLHSH